MAKSIFSFISSKEPNERPFFVMVTLIIGGMAAWTVAQNPSLQQPGPLALYTLLVTAHIALHWFSDRIVQGPYRTAGYLVVQGALAFAIATMSKNLGMIFAPYLGLIGETFGILGITPIGLLTIAGYVILSFVNFTQFSDPADAVWWLIGIFPMVMFVGIYVTLYNRQSEARARAQALLGELEAANRQLSEYAARVEDLTIASERQRMARDLHDTLSQGLAGLILQLEAVDAHLASSRYERAQNIVKQAMERARATLDDARQTIQDLRSGSNPHRDLAEAVHQEVERFTRSTGVACDVEVALPEELPEGYGELVQRAVAESLTNVARHAQAKRVQVRLAQPGSNLLLEVQDDGCGFDPRQVQPGHYGLLGMRERSRLAGGSLMIKSQAGHGTTVSVCLPLDKESRKKPGLADLKEGSDA